MKKVLVAEDDKFLSNAYRVKLTKAGFDVRFAQDGAEALNLLGEFIPDVIILDLVMPDMDGFAFLSKIKSNDNWKNIPVIVASNLGQSEDVMKATKLGADDYIVKTDLTMKKLIEKINSIVGG